MEGVRAESQAPPSRRTDPADRIDKAVAFINERARVIAAEMITIGEYLLREFFGNDPRAVASKDPRKMGSFRDLAAREDCVLSYWTLWRAVNLAIQERKLGTVASMQQLSPTHKLQLLPLDDVPEKRQLAKKAAEEGWSTRELRDEVRRRKKKAPGDKERVRGGGAIALAEGSLKHVARAADAGALAPETLDDIPASRLERLLALMDDVVAKLTRSVKVGRRALAERRSTRAGGSAA
jgi:hypothetical protein